MINSTMNNPYVDLLVGKCFYLDGDRISILKRKHGLEVKPPLYTFIIAKKCYLSSLIPTDKNTVFNFDNKYTHKAYQLIFNPDNESITVNLLE